MQNIRCRKVRIKWIGLFNRGIEEEKIVLAQWYVLKRPTSWDCAAKIIVWDVSARSMDAQDEVLSITCTERHAIQQMHNRKLKTYITLRLEIFVSSLGTGPVKWLSLSRLEKNRKSEGGKKVNRLTYWVPRTATKEHMVAFELKYQCSQEY